MSLDNYNPAMAVNIAIGVYENILEDFKPVLELSNDKFKAFEMIVDLYNKYEKELNELNG